MWARRPSWPAASELMQVIPGSETALRSNNFDAFRLLAALLVIWSHQFAVLGRPIPKLLYDEPGAVGVVVFFAISGYLVMLSWLADPHLGRFAMRRVLRIWPGLTAAVVLCALALGPLVSSLSLDAYFAHPLTWSYFSNLWLQTRYELPGVFETNVLRTAVNGPLWTIPLEVGCYVALAAAGALGLLRWRHTAPLIFVALMVALWRRYSIAPGEPMPEWSFALQYAMVFSLGATLACWRHLWISRRMLALALLLAGCVLLHAKGPLILVLQAPLLAMAVLAVILGSASTPLLRQAGRFGDLSYGLYIYAFPVQQTVVWYFSGRIGFGAALACSLVGAGLLAMLSWHLVEKKALAFKPRKPTVSSSLDIPAHLSS